jgi:hypothetical protein
MLEQQHFLYKFAEHFDLNSFTQKMYENETAYIKYKRQ